MYIEVYKLLRKELEHEKLSELPPDFYKKSLIYVKKLERKVRDPVVLCSKIAEAELESFKTLMIYLYKVRLRKIIKNLQLREDIGELALRGIFPELPIKKIEERKETSVKQANLVLVRITVDSLPQIIDDKGFIYGPFKKDDLVYIPKEVADLLRNQGVCIMVEEDLEVNINESP